MLLSFSREILFHLSVSMDELNICVVFVAPVSYDGADIIVVWERDVCR
jgi:hypothetical protein